VTNGSSESSQGKGKARRKRRLRSFEVPKLIRIQATTIKALVSGRPGFAGWTWIKHEK